MSEDVNPSCGYLLDPTHSFSRACRYLPIVMVKLLGDSLAFLESNCAADVGQPDQMARY